MIIGHSENNLKHTFNRQNSCPCLTSLDYLFFTLTNRFLINPTKIIKTNRIAANIYESIIYW